jgi:hypothetical protein
MEKTKSNNKIRAIYYKSSYLQLMNREEGLCLFAFFFYTILQNEKKDERGEGTGVRDFPLIGILH